MSYDKYRALFVIHGTPKNPHFKFINDFIPKHVKHVDVKVSVTKPIDEDNVIFELKSERPLEDLEVEQTNYGTFKFTEGITSINKILDEGSDFFQIEFSKLFIPDNVDIRIELEEI